MNYKQIIAVLAFIGGLVHLLAAFGTNLLAYLGIFAPWVQGIAGLSIIILTFKHLMGK